MLRGTIGMMMRAAAAAASAYYNERCRPALPFRQKVFLNVTSGYRLGLLGHACLLGHRLAHAYAENGPKKPILLSSSRSPAPLTITESQLAAARKGSMVLSSVLEGGKGRYSTS